jgi:hypothetical protein
VIELKHERIGLPAIDAWVLQQVGEDVAA